VSFEVFLRKKEKRARVHFVTNTVLSSGWNVTAKRKRKEVIDVEEVHKQKELKDLEKLETHYRWLTTIDEIQYIKVKQKQVYFGRKEGDESTKRKIQTTFLMEYISQFFDNAWEEINKAKPRSWQKIPESLKDFIRSFGRCYSDNVLFTSFEKCNEKDWNYVKITSNCNYPTTICDSPTDFRHDNSCYISFTGNKTKGFEVQYVPLYYMRIWL
jgi:hypothetical protein